jgi:hypothetical protein
MGGYSYPEIDLSGSSRYGSVAELEAELERLKKS